MASLQAPFPRSSRRAFSPVMNWLISWLIGGILLAMIFAHTKETEQDSAESIEQGAAAGERQGSVGTAASTSSARTNAAKPDLIWSPERRFQYIVQQSERALIYLVTVIGLICLGCLSGLPSTKCYALADTYAIALQILGPLFFLTFLAFALLSLTREAIEQKIPKFVSSNFQKMKIYLPIGFVFLIVFVSVGFLTTRGPSNIRFAINHCLGNTPHTKIPLYRNPLFDKRT